MAPRPSTAADITARLHTQLAIPARDFGALLGLDPAEVTSAVFQKRIGVPTFQIIERGRHMVSCTDVLAFLAERGIAVAPPVTANA